MFKLFAPFIVSAVASTALAAPISYAVLPFQASGTVVNDPGSGAVQSTASSTATGTITTDGKLGNLTDADIIGYDGNPIPNTVDVNNPITVTANGLFATGSALSLLPGGELMINSRVVLDGTFTVANDTYTFTAVTNGVTWSDGGGKSGYGTVSYHFSGTTYVTPGAPLVIATAAPEPSSLGLAAFGGLALLAWRCRRALQSRA
jgi:hypothetical protein